MKLSTVVFSLLVAAVSVRAADKQYIVSFSDEASANEVKTAQDTLTGKGCTITHLYTIIKGFAVTCPEEDMTAYQNSVSTMSGNKPTVEEDQIVTTQGKSS